MSSCHVVRLSPSQTAIKPGGKMGRRGASLSLNEAAKINIISGPEC